MAQAAAAIRPTPDPEPARIHQIRIAAADPASFGDFERARCVAEIGSRAELWRDGQLLAWVLMPDHWQGLVQIGALDSLPTAVARLKSLTTRAVRRSEPDTVRLWRHAYRERQLGEHEDVTDAARRMVARPLRAGLVQRLGDYAFWDAVWL
jgi:putative transposase